jgi:hypothetical protein
MDRRPLTNFAEMLGRRPRVERRTSSLKRKDNAMIEIVMKLWLLIPEHYIHSHLMVVCMVWLLCWAAVQMCIFSLTLWLALRLMPLLDKAPDRLELWWRGEPGA